LTKQRSEKYLKKLVGRTEIEDALKRLDKLTQEEARMAAAQNLKVTHAIDERVKGVADTVVAIDNRVAGVDDRVAGVGDQVAGVGDQVASVGDQVAGVDDRVQQSANGIDELKRLSSPNLVSPDYGTLRSFQGTNYGRAFTNGSRHLTPRQTTTSHVVPSTRKQQLGFFKAASFRSGSQRLRFSGSTENVCSISFQFNSL
jgi:hypothetical protein